MLNRQHNNNKQLAGKLTIVSRILRILMLCSLGVCCLTGCNVKVAGKQRPLLVYNGIKGEVELSAERRTDKQGTSGNERESETKVFEERVRFKTDGDVYHPDFLLYSAALGLGLAQQSIDSDDETGHDDESLNDYNLFAQLLRGKPYPMTFYANKSEDLISRQFLGSLRTDRENRGASMSLQSKSWPMTIQYTASETNQDGLATLARDYFNRDDERFRYYISHDFDNLSRISFNYDRTDVTQQSTGARIETTTDRYTLLHDLIFGDDEKSRLDLYANYVDQSGTFNFENLQLEERLRLQHTPGFLTNYEVRYTDSKRDTYSNTETRGRAGFEHKLYESLRTTAYMFISKTDLDNQGNLTQHGGTLAFDYTKKNPWGILLSNYTINLTKSKQSGGSDIGVVIDESHTATELIPVELDRVNIDVSTIVVKNDIGLPYQEGEDYTITESNGRVWLNIITVGGVVLPNFSEGDEFFVDYNFYIEPERQEDTLRQNFTIRERFKNGLSLYYAHRRQDEDVSSTNTEITPDEFTINTVGADFVHKGLFLQAEYSKEDSTQIPSTSKKVLGRYSWSINSGTRMGLRAMNQWLDFDEPDERDVVLFKAGTEIFSRLTDTCNVSARADYRDEDDTRFGTTRGFQVNSELQYNYRQLNITSGIELNFLDRRNDKIDGTFLYVKLKRLF